MTRMRVVLFIIFCCSLPQRSVQEVGGEKDREVDSKTYLKCYKMKMGSTQTRWDRISKREGGRKEEKHISHTQNNQPHGGKFLPIRCTTGVAAIIGNFFDLSQNKGTIFKYILSLIVWQASTSCGEREREREREGE